MKKNSLVSVVIPTHNRKTMLIRLLKGLLENDYQHIEIIIIDDASTDGTAALVQQTFRDEKKITLVSNKRNLYTAGSRNKGAHLATGDYIFFIDDDNVVTHTVISHLVAVMDTDKMVGEVGPMMYYYIEKNKIFWAGTQRNMTTSKTNFINNFSELPKENIWKTDDVLNAFMVRANVIKHNKISFIENLGIMYEESDYAWKIKKTGYKIVAVKNAVIYHDVEDPGDAPGAFLYHTLKDKRRVYFTARNRLIFHTLYSSFWQSIGIILFWQWLFVGYYVVNIIRYQGKEAYSFKQKLIFIYEYFHGICDGVTFFFKKKKLTSF